MRYTITYPDGDSPIDRVEVPHSVHRLANAASFDTVSRACRDAALSFMDGVAHGWQKVDLAMWLSREYGDATRFAGDVERSERPRPSQIEADALDIGRLEDLMQNARMHTLALCEELALPKCDSDFIDDAIARGLLLPAKDETGALLWVPLATSRMRLRDRVRALFTVDYLLAPEEYERSFFVCHRCERVVFDSLAKQIGQCSLHRRQSGIVKKDSDAEDHEPRTTSGVRATGISHADGDSSEDVERVGGAAESRSYDPDTFGQAG